MSFDGKMLTLLGKNLNLYTQLEVPGTIDNLVDELKDTYQWPLPAAETGDPGALYTITVVDDQDRPFRFYGTGEYETYNPKPIDDDGGKAAGEENGT